MPEYRIFRLDDEGKILKSSEAIKFESDQDAVREMRKTHNGATIEIWEGLRRIAIIRLNEKEEPRV
jgi:hypothetical protein